VVGAGRIGLQHAHAIEGSARLSLAAVVDPRDAALATVPGADTLRLPDLAALLRRTPIDGAIVAVPSVLHLEVVSRLLDASVPVLCEKPCGLTSAQAREIGERAAAAGVPVQVGYWRRHLPELQALRRRIRAGELGTLAMLAASQRDREPPSAAFRDPRSSGGIVVDMGVHEFDMLRWLTGQEIVALTGFASETTYASPVAGDPETVNLVAHLSGGPTAVISLARRNPPGDFCSVEVLGGRERLVLDYIEPADAAEQMLTALRRQAEAFAEAAASGSVAGATVADAVAALAAAELARAGLEETSQALANR
jgi:myo-inositol 2-dehydrogenase/D-chiro-inositol 1-dehydrogenase